ncbi:hypothetical protein AM499_14000 [Bacillus sp. FJAT-22090]|uniref:YqjF family protein n=1 Tax=Bacillus sp. FJAT-22090 TaxID=1581038 RepID=UPI0006AFFB30|nr:DUF2071 domain-containing protein [Bacillus sp. FJAT-22090]ALC86812.1 hypothetical protein AM499_14000 [Bacillus sp. FJAT-22090]
MRPWVMTQEWRDVLFLHWPVSAKDIRDHIPSELKLDLYDNMAWLGLVSFQVKGNRPRLVPPIPGLSSYLELNVRTYVSYKGKSGVFFFSLDANNPVIVKLATIGNFLPYRQANIHLQKRNNIFSVSSKVSNANSIPETLITSFEPMPEIMEGTSLERWLTERYCLWTKINNDLYRVDIWHAPWKLQNVKGGVVENSMASFLKGDYQKNPPIAHYSKRKKVRSYLPIKEK